MINNTTKDKNNYYKDFKYIFKIIYPVKNKYKSIPKNFPTFIQIISGKCLVYWVIREII